MKNVLLVMGLMMMGSATFAAEASPSLSCKIYDSSTGETLVTTEKDKGEDSERFLIYDLNTSKGIVAMGMEIKSKNISISGPFGNGKHPAAATALGKLTFQAEGLIVSCEQK